MKKFLFALITGLMFCHIDFGQHFATIKEYEKTFTTYPFSDPNPIPEPSRIYPYFRYDGFTDNPVDVSWKVVELENDFIKVIILPEIGGKVWTAIEKSTGKDYLYNNHVIKFRDIAMRGPWTSGGIEANYGVMGHSPSCSTPVNYLLQNKEDGSVSCIIGVLDLVTRTKWYIDINLPNDKACFTTRSFWYNSSGIEQPYYTWMNTGIKSSGNLELIYPGTQHLGHDGLANDWSFDVKECKDVSFYDNNDFGSYKSYHVVGKYTDFFGGYWHDDKYGMARYSLRDEKPGKKIWIWGLSQQGMLWEKLLTDNDGQYVEVQSGRLFNQAEMSSSFTPFKHKEFLPYSTDLWTEYWFPVMDINGFVKANDIGALNIDMKNKWLKISISPIQYIKDDLTISDGNSIIFSKSLSLSPLETYADSIKLNDEYIDLTISIGDNKMVYHTDPAYSVLNRPTQSPAEFEWESVYGLYIQGKELIRQKYYLQAKEKLSACLKLNPYYVPALTDLSMLLIKELRYQEALSTIRKALSVDTYYPAANYYYGLINTKLGNFFDAIDGFDIAAMSTEYRSAAYTSLSKLYLLQSDYTKSLVYAQKSIDFNRYAIDAYKQMAVNYRILNDEKKAKEILNIIENFDPLSQFSRIENYFWDSDESVCREISKITNGELSEHLYLELAIWYYNIGQKKDAVQVLKMSPKNLIADYWLAFLQNTDIHPDKLKSDYIFPFRPETAEILSQLIENNNYWLLKYHLALIYWNTNNPENAAQLFLDCDMQKPEYAPFYGSMAAFFFDKDKNKSLQSLLKAIDLDPVEWRFGKDLTELYLSIDQPKNAEIIAAKYYKLNPENYFLGQLYIKSLIKNEKYKYADDVLSKILVLPNEGARIGRQLYKETELMLAIQEFEKKHYRKSIDFVDKARIWPDNLGVGKPYIADVDERLEDWIAFLNYEKIKNDEGMKKMLDKIISDKKFYTDNGKHVPSINNILTLLALKKAGRENEAEDYLSNWMEKHPENEILNWISSTYHNNEDVVIKDAELDENYRLLKVLLEKSLLQ